MALGSELFSLATSFDPYGAMRKGEMAPQAYDVEQQKLGLEQQKMGLQKLQLAEQQKELQAEQGKIPELATMSQNVLGTQFKLNDDTGLPTVAGQMNTFLLQSKQEASQGQKLLQQAQFESDPKSKASLISEGRRLLNNAVKYQGDAKKLAQTEQNNLLYGLSTAANQTEWDNNLKGWDNSGLPLPKGFPTEYSPENMKKISATAPLDVQQKIQTELRRREEDKRKQNKELRDEHRDIIRDRKDDLQIQRLEGLIAKGVGGEGGGKIKITSPVDKQLNEAEQSLVLSQKIESSLSDPKIAKSLNGTKLLRSLLETPKEMGSIDKIVRTNIFEKLPKDSQELVIELANLRNAYYKQQSGLAVTGGEAARNFFAVVQPTDNVETLITKLRVQKQKSLSILEDGIQDYKLPPGRERRYQEIIGKEKTSKETPKETPTETKPTETKPSEIPTIPSGVPPTAQYSPSQKKWWWKKTDGTWESK